MKLCFYGGAKTVTGANYLLAVKKKNILIDCGLFQGAPEMEQRNRESFPYDPRSIDFVLITHAHLDHIGRLPKLIKDGFTGKIFATAPTVDFARLMLEDSQRVLEEKAVKAGVLSLMDGDEVERIMEMFKIVDYDERIELDRGIVVCFREAGHVLGSSVIELEAEKKKIVFSGDLGSRLTPILRPPAKIQDADYIIVESAYGDRLHKDRKICKDLLEDAAEETIRRGGVLMIPSFALERTQQLLYHFNELIEHHRIPAVPIFVDSPLAIKLTEIYRRYPQYYDQEASALLKYDDMFKFPGLRFALTSKESKDINDIAPPKIIIAGSGMSQGGRIIHHEARYLPDPKSTLLIVTYQAEGTVGRQLADGAKRVELFDRMTLVKARVERIDGYSSHADQKELTDWICDFTSSENKCRPKKVFVCQGEEGPANELAQIIKDRLGLNAEVPALGDYAEL